MADRKNVDNWYVTRKELEENSPSRRDGISLKNENLLLKKCIHFLVENGKKFRFHLSIIATANVFCHRFFLRRSHAKYEWYRIAIASLFLAAKVEDCMFDLDSFGLEGWRETVKEVFKKEIPIEELKKIVVDDEMEILVTINFDLNVDHPYKYYVELVRKVKNVPVEVNRPAMEFMNQCFFSPLCLQFNPQKIAGASFHLAYKFLKLKLPFQEEEGYCDFFQMTPNELQDISSQLMELYEYRPPPDTAPGNQSPPSSSLTGSQSLSESASTSAPPPLAADGNKSMSASAVPDHVSPPPPAAPRL